MKRYPWPGNVRELQNICERASVLSRDNRISAGLIQPWLLAPLRFPRTRRRPVAGRRQPPPRHPPRSPPLQLHGPPTRNPPPPSSSRSPVRSKSSNASRSSAPSGSSTATARTPPRRWASASAPSASSSRSGRSRTLSRKPLKSSTPPRVQRGAQRRRLHRAGLARPRRPMRSPSRANPVTTGLRLRRPWHCGCLCVRQMGQGRGDSEEFAAEAAHASAARQRPISDTERSPTGPEPPAA